MKDINKLANILKFYVKANKLKTTRKNTNINRSISDDIYGSIILTIAFSSEFDLKENLTDIIQMLILSNLNDDDTKDLKDYLKLSKLLRDYRFNVGSEAILAHKFDKLNRVFSEIMMSNLTDEEKIDECVKILEPQNDIYLAKYREICCFYIKNYKLTELIRSGWDKTHWNIIEKNIRIERISDHIISTLVLLIAISSECNYKLDYDKVYRMLALHEIGETQIGDITPFDNVTKEKKQEIEHKAQENVLGNLNKKDELLQDLYTFDSLKTNESLLAHYIDKIEADLQSKMYQETNQHHSLNDQENNCIFKSQKVKKMLLNGDVNTPFDIWYYYDLPIYEDEYFSEFRNLLNIAKCNNLLELDKNVIREEINLDEVSSLKIENQIIDIVNTFRQDKNIESVLLSTKQDDKTGIIYITILFNNLVDSYLTDYFNRHLNNDKVKIMVRCDSMERYITKNSCPMEFEKYQELISSSIVFDRNGLIKSKKNNCNSYYLGHNKSVLGTVLYNPPIIEKILKKYEHK